MAIDFGGWSVTDSYATAIIPKLNGVLAGFACGLDPAFVGYVGVPSGGAKRINSAAGVLEQFDGTSWTELLLKASVANAAKKLATPRKINGVNFDGSSDIAISDGSRVLKSGDTMSGVLLLSRGNGISGIVGESSAEDAFTVDTDKVLAHYGLSWKAFSDATGGTSAALTGYGGVRLYTEGTERVRVTKVGNVGIGTPEPAALLHVSGASLPGGATGINLSNTQVGAGVFSMNYVGTGFTYGGIGAGDSLLLAADSGALALATFSAKPIKLVTGAAERMRIDAAGNVGIGTTAPARRLDVAGGARTAPVAAAYAAAVTIDAATGNAFIVGALTGNTTLVINNGAEGQFITVRFRQDSTGGRTVTVPAGAKVNGSIASGANRTSYLSLTYNGVDARWEGSWTAIPA